LINADAKSCQQQPYLRVGDEMWQKGAAKQEGHLTMERTSSRSSVLLLAIGLAMASTVLPCQAGSTGNGSAGSGQARFNNGMGLQQFRFEADAQKHCANDPVVWGAAQIRASSSPRTRDRNVSAAISHAWRKLVAPVTRS